MEEDDDELLAVSYQGVTPGVPVLTRDGTQFGILEHVLEVPEEDLFDGIVVWTGAWPAGLTGGSSATWAGARRPPRGGLSCSSRSTCGSSTRTRSR